MTGTSASQSRTAATLLLPAPLVRLAPNRALTQYDISLGGPSSGNVQSVVPLDLVTISVHGLPASVMEDLSAFLPKLEMLRYVRKRSTRSTWSRNMQTKGYVHPAHGPAPSGNGSHTHGGEPLNLPPATRSIRPTEWDVTNWGQVIDATQGLCGFLNMRRVQWRDDAGNIQAVDLPCPAGRGGSSGMGRRYPYEHFFQPGYYQFRWSVTDPTDSRGQRISGPLSPVVSMTTNIFPFVPELPFTSKATASLDPRLEARELRAWVGSVSRLPR